MTEFPAIDLASLVGVSGGKKPICKYSKKTKRWTCIIPK